jgi:uncharacterized membrane protein
MADAKETIMSSCDKIVNINPNERTASLVGGGALIALGLSRHNLSGLLLVLAGASLLYRGKTGYCGLYAAQGKKSL